MPSRYVEQTKTLNFVNNITFTRNTVKHKAHFTALSSVLATRDIFDANLAEKERIFENILNEEDRVLPELCTKRLTTFLCKTEKNFVNLLITTCNYKSILFWRARWTLFKQNLSGLETY